MPETGLAMVRLSLDGRRLAKLAERLRLLPKQEDSGYLVHACLADLFGSGAVQPFYLPPADKNFHRVSVLGYSSATEADLRAHADSFADPGNHAACDWREMAVKSLPAAWHPERLLGFQVRACPVIRLSASIETTNKAGEAVTYAAGSEVDAWLHRRFLSESPDADATRQAVYASWLRARLEGAAKLEGAQLTSFRRVRLVRRRQGKERKPHTIKRPDALLTGALRVVDGAAFSRLLANGIGRHRAFGFGMLLLKPPP